jgi:hypothetical protein
MNVSKGCATSIQKVEMMLLNERGLAVIVSAGSLKDVNHDVDAAAYEYC